MVNQLQEIAGADDVPEKRSRSHDVAAIIVTFNPDPERLWRGLSEIGRQVGCVVVVDNASHNLDQCQLDQLGRGLDIRLEIVLQHRNVGLGAGFNAGIEVADKLGYSFVVLFDQDSVPQAGMVGVLKQSYEALTSSGVRVAAVGPRFRDAGGGTLSNFISCDANNDKRSYCQEEIGTVMTNFLISSGSFITMRAIKDVGMMDESLFIDYVDAEWCLRGRSKGWTMHGVCAAVMEHSIGESRRRIWFIGWRNVSFHKPFRYYYIFRNSLLLRHRAYVPEDWKKANLLRNILLAGYLLGFAPGRFANLRMIWGGIMDGRKGVAGQMPAE